MADEEGSDDETAMPQEIKKQGFGIHAKKFWVTKAAGTSVGRKVIFSHLGEAGLELVNSLHDATARDIGPKEAKRTQEILLRMALKAKILFDEKLVVLQDVRHLTEPVQNLMLKLNEVLKEANAEQREMDSLIANITRVRDSVVQLMEPHIREKNVQKLRDLFLYYGSADFLNKILNQPEYKAEKIGITKSLEKVLKPLLDELNFDPNLTLCLTPECDEWSLKKTGDFRGSKYCAVHHQQVLAELSADTSKYLQYMLNGDGKDYPAFNDFVDQQTGIPNLVRFYQVLSNYHVAPLKIRRIFAVEVAKKYISPDGSHCMQLDLVRSFDLDGLQVQLEERQVQPSAELFEPIRQQVLAIISEQAWQQWLSTSMHKTYDLSLQVPEWAR